MAELPEPDSAVDVRAPRAGRAYATLQDLEVYRASRFAVWVFDIDNSRILWANQAGLEVWAAASLEDLMARDLALDMSPAIRARLQQYAPEFWKGIHFDEQWTLFPHGTPRTVLYRLRGCLLDSGRMAMLCEAQVTNPENAHLLRGSQALLYTTMMVTTYSDSGDCTYANPAARNSFSAEEQSSTRRFMNPDLRAILNGDLGLQREGTWRSEVATSRGTRTHEVEVRQSHDPVEGLANFLVTELDVTEQEAAIRKMANLVTRDSLTGLRNRTYLATAAAEFLKSATERGETVGLLLLDVDRFKLVNDSLGHAAGDMLLQGIARRLGVVLPETGVLTRLGGDEFCCLLSSSAGEKAFARTASAVLKELRKPFAVDNYNLNISASIGLSMAEGGQTSFDSLLRRADLALFDAKGKGGDRMRAFRPELAERSRRFLELDAELREALSRNRLELYYQPRISFKTGKIVAAEALIRMNSANGAMVLPAEFIPIAEATGRIAAVGRWVLREATRHLLLVRGAGSTINLSVNVSPKQFADPAFLALLRQVRPLIDGVRGEIELEITENVLIESDRRLQRVLMQISKLGYRLAIDDFGTAYSNLASLTRYPISCIKIDRTLVAHKDFRLLLTGVMTIARAFGAKIVAEGVETESQRQWLEESLCDEYQGYLYSKPVPFAELKRMIAADGLQGLAGEI
ncbi:MAG: putative bifunctional diguanylate cyclase/phosphodiesterase [Cypionkella sp.]